MSRITNADPIKRGSALSSTQLNQQFTEVNAAFPMDGDNVRNEGLDQPAFDTHPTTGKSGVILVAAASDNDNNSITVQANTQTSPLFDPADEVHKWEGFIQQVTNADVIRVYWQFDYLTAMLTDDLPVTDRNNNGLVWAIWLEYKDSGGTWAPVPHQEDMSITSKATTSLTYGCTLVPHAVVFYDTAFSAADNPQALAGNPSTGYGDWIYCPPSTLNIYGLRLMVRGMLSCSFNVTDNNCWFLSANTISPNPITISRSDMSYLVMRKQ